MSYLAYCNTSLLASADSAVAERTSQSCVLFAANGCLGLLSSCLNPYMTAGRLTLDLKRSHKVADPFIPKTVLQTVLF